MSSKRHRHQGATTPNTEAQDNPAVAQFSMSEVAQFSVTLDTACWFSGELCWQAGYRFGVWGRGLNAALAARAAQAAAAPSPEPAPEPAAPVSSSSSSSSSTGIVPLCPGAWWDLIDPSEAAEADSELPLRWAV